MIVECYLCGDMCFDGCKDESKDLIEHYNNSWYHKDKLKDGFGKYHLFGSDHKNRYNIGCDIEEFLNELEHCGNYLP